VIRRISIREERGQTVAEFALVLPLLMLILLAILQFGVLFRDYLAVTDAVRAGARTAAVSRSAAVPEEACEKAVERSASDLNVADALEVECDTPAGWNPGEDVVVTATYPYEISLLGQVVRSGRFSSTTTERIE
jgi:Flp pilus assembly protein TadG